MNKNLNSDVEKMLDEKNDNMHITLDELNKLIDKAFIYGYGGGAPYEYKSIADAKESANTP